ncbi:MAG: S-layer homology domain-containing protein [Clostridia bacterium]|nr:S-layer homology domain-containing protein [Clostridia bacterium]
MKKVFALLLAGIMTLTTFTAFAEEEEAKPIMIAPTVELSADRQTAYSIKERPKKSADYKVVNLEAPTKVAEENGNVEHVLNPGFESSSDTLNLNWGQGGLEGGKWGESGGFFEKKDVHGGSIAAHTVAAEGKNVHFLQSLGNVLGGQEYELTAWVKRVSGSPTISLTCIYRDPETLMSMEYTNRVNLQFGDAPGGVWTRKTIRFTLPEDVISVTLMARLIGGGEAYWDDFSLVGPSRPAKKMSMPEYIAPTADSVNLLKDASFEEADDVKHIKHGTEEEGYWFDRDDDVLRGWYTYSDEEAHTGTKSLKLNCDNNVMPWVGQAIKVKPETTYQLSMWVKIPRGTQETYHFQGDCFTYSSKATEPDNYFKDGRRSLHVYPDFDNNEWQQVVTVFSTPTEAAYYHIMIRTGGNSVSYFDDVELYELSGLSKKIRTFSPDDVFYYSDYEGNGYADLKTYLSTSDEEQKVRFRFYDGEKVLLEEIATVLPDGTQRFNYPLELLSEKKKEYRLEAMMLGPNGEETEDTLSRYIYKYDRPTKLNEAMQLITNGDKVIQNYVLAQGTSPEIMYRISEVGATIGRGIGTVRTDRTERLDVAWQAGMYATTTLFNHEDIRDPEVYAQVVDTINRVKDHPAHIGWYLWEEPKFAGDDIDLDENLRIGAKLIRDLDPEHPLFGVLSERLYSQEFGKYCDIIDMDLYPAQIYDNRRGENVAKGIAMGLEENDWQIPIGIMTQAFEWFDFQPTWNDLRNYVYACMFEGANGFSFHTFGKETSTAENGTCVKPGDERWNGMVKAAEWEYDFIFDHFTKMKAPLFNEGRTEDVWWRTVVRDGELYAIAINMWENQKSTIDIPLVDHTGKIKINGAKAELVEGGDAKTVTITGDTFHIELDNFQVAVYKITPNEAVDFSDVKVTRFRDLQHHVWARDAIIEMDEKGIVNDLSYIAYAPGRNVTRGDFAMFLVRALGLTGDGTEANFDDVSASREYAKDIAIGKAAGILNGVGDNKFNPDVEISRQDMMTIISRGMALSGESDLSAFSDSSQIADYALSHVKAMIASGLVKGNADGTLNPLGQTTRAEAAVIMQRIVNR